MADYAHHTKSITRLPLLLKVLTETPLSEKATKGLDSVKASESSLSP